MDKDLQAIKDKWESRPAAGPASSDPNGAELRAEDDSVYKLSDKYVAAHPDDFAGLDRMGLELVVKLLEEAQPGSIRRGCSTVLSRRTSAASMRRRLGRQANGQRLRHH